MNKLLLFVLILFLSGLFSCSDYGFVYNIKDVTIPDQIITPVFSIQSGNYSTAQAVSITSDTPGSIIYYSLEGSFPRSQWEYNYSGSPISVFNQYLHAVAVIGDNYSDVARLFIREEGFPDIASLDPEISTSRVGEPITLTLITSDDDGESDIALIRLSIRVEGHGTTGLNLQCICFEYTGGNNIQFFNNTIDPPAFESTVFGSDTNLESTTCIFDPSQSSVVRDGNTVTLSLNITPKEGFLLPSNVKRIWSWVYDSPSNVDRNSIVRQIGTWTINE